MSVHLDICNVHDEYNNKTPHLINMDQIFSLINQKALHDVHNCMHKALSLMHAVILSIQFRPRPNLRNQSLQLFGFCFFNFYSNYFPNSIQTI